MKNREQKNGPDWRNTLFQFHASAIPKYNLRPTEIALFTALLSSVNPDGTVSKSNASLMRETGIHDERTLRRARQRLLDVHLIRNMIKGSNWRGNTKYTIKLLSRPKRKISSLDSEK